MDGSIDLTIAAYNLGDLGEKEQERYRRAVKKALESRYPTTVVSVDVHVNRAKCQMFHDAVECSGQDENGEKIKGRAVLDVVQEVWNQGGW